MPNALQLINSTGDSSSVIAGIERDIKYEIDISISFIVHFIRVFNFLVPSTFRRSYGSRGKSCIPWNARKISKALESLFKIYPFKKNFPSDNYLGKMK